MSIILLENFLSEDDIAYILQLPEVISAKSKLESSGKIYFTIKLTESLRTAINNKFGLNLSGEIPMRWIKGDTSPHIDRGKSEFENTYLVYLNDSPGEIIIDNCSYPISKNTGFMFNEGIIHGTINTGNTPRLLLGPMNELAEPVGTPLFYYNNYADAVAMNGNTIATSGSYILGTSIFGDIGSYNYWRIATYVGGGGPPPSGVYNNGFDLSVFGFYNYYVYPSSPCFLEGTKILCQVEGADKYVAVENLSKDMLVKTSRDGYKKVVLVGKSKIQNPGNKDRLENRLYKCSPSKYKELDEDLYITGCHSILVDTISEKQKEDLIKHLGKIFVTDRKYRLIACVDERAEPWESEGCYNIWHFALENKDESMNYGVYANGALLVETCSINFLKNKSNMSLY